MLFIIVGKSSFIIFTFLAGFQQKRGIGEMAEGKNATFAPQAPFCCVFCGVPMFFFLRNFGLEQS